MKAVTKKEWKRKNGTWCSISTDKKACNNARPPDTAKLRCTIRMGSETSYKSVLYSWIRL